MQCEVEKIKEEIVELLTVKQLLEYQKKYNTEPSLTEKEAEIILDYFEGHDYIIGHANGILLRGDINDKIGETIWEKYEIDDVVDLVCEWNYEFILDASAEMEVTNDPIELSRLQSSYNYLKSQEVVLDGLFDRTKYGRLIEGLAVKLADELISKASKGENISDTVESITTSIPKLETSGRAR